MKGKYEEKIIIISWHFSICVTQPYYTFNKILKKNSYSACIRTTLLTLSLAA